MSLRPANPPTLTKALILEQHVRVTDLLVQIHIDRVRELAKTQPVYVPSDDKRGGTLYLPPRVNGLKIRGPVFFHLLNSF